MPSKASFFDRLRGALRSSPLNNRAVPLSAPEAWGWITGGSVSEAGEVVNEQTVLSISTAYACIRVLSESVASLPCRVYRLTDKGRTLAKDHRLTTLLGTSPNPECTSFTAFEVLVKSMALCGNGYLQIERDADNQPIALWPLNPREVQPIRLDTGALAYRVTDGMAGGQSRIVLAADMIHCPLFPAWDGIVGLSPFQLSMQTFGQARAAEKFGSPVLPQLRDTRHRSHDRCRGDPQRQGEHAGGVGGHAIREQ